MAHRTNCKAIRIQINAWKEDMDSGKVMLWLRGWSTLSSSGLTRLRSTLKTTLMAIKATTLMATRFLLNRWPTPMER